MVLFLMKVKAGEEGTSRVRDGYILGLCGREGWLTGEVFCFIGSLRIYGGRGYCGGREFWRR